MATHRKLALALGLAVFLLYLSTAGLHIYSPDAEVQFRTARSLATLRGVAVDPIQDAFATAQGRDGRYYAQYGIGVPLVAAPFHWLGYPLAALLPADADVMWHVDGRPITEIDREAAQAYLGQPIGRHFRERLGVSMTNLAVGALLAVVIFLWVRRIFNSDLAGLATAGLYATCTVNWPHTQDLFSEPLAALGWMLAFYFVYLARDVTPRDPSSPTRAGGTRCVLLAGPSFALALLARNDSILALPGVLLFLAWPLWPLRQAWRGRALRVAVFLVPVALVVLFVLAFNHYRFGSPFKTGYEVVQLEGQNLAPKFAWWILPYGTPGQLVSFGKGLLIHAPILLAAAATALFRWREPGTRAAVGVGGSVALLIWSIGFWWTGWRLEGAAHVLELAALVSLPLALGWAFGHQLWLRDRALAAGVWTSVGAMFFIMSAYEQWPAGWCWGPRHIFQIVPFLALPLGWYFCRQAGGMSRARAYALSGLVGLSLLVQLPGLSVSFMDAHARHMYGPASDRNIVWTFDHSVPMLHVDVMHFGTQYLDMALLRWLLLGQDPLRFGVLLLPALLGGLIWWMTRLLREPTANAR